MIINTGSRSRRLKQWHTWFAWYPVRLVYQKYAWLENIERKKNYTWGGDPEWDYRIPTKE